MSNKHLHWEWRFNPSVVLAIVLAATAGIAGFVRAEGQIDANEHHLESLGTTIEKVSEAVRLAERNNAVLMQWQAEQDRRLDRLEGGIG